MGVPSTRTPVRIARGTYANLSTVDALAAIDEGEICFATDQQRLYVKQGGGLTPISAASAAAPAPSNVSASPAFAGGTGTQADPYQITAVGVPLSGGTATSAQTVTVTGGPGDFLIVTDQSPAASGDRFANQSVGNLNAAGTIDIQFTYEDTPGTAIDNVTYVGQFKIGTTYFVWNVVQSALAPLTQDSAATISGTVSVGSTLTCNPGAVVGGTEPRSVAGYQWQKSFDGISSFFNIAGATSADYDVLGSDSNTYLRCVATHEDGTDPLQGGPLTVSLTTGVTIQVPASAAPVINNVTFTEDDSTGDRFTNQTFSVDVDMLNDGAPVSQKGIKATVTADMSTFSDFETQSTSYTDNRPSGSVSTTFKAETSDSRWGDQNTTSDNYYWYGRGQVAYVEPGTANVYLGIFQTTFYSSNSTTTRHQSRANLTATSSSLVESGFQYVGQGAYSGSAYGNWGRQTSFRDAPLAPDGTTPIIWGVGAYGYSHLYGYMFKTNNWTSSSGSAMTDNVRLALIDKNYRCWMLSPQRRKSDGGNGYAELLSISQQGPWTDLPNLSYTINNGTSYGVIALNSTGSEIVHVAGLNNLTVKHWNVDDLNQPTYIHNFTCQEPQIHSQYPSEKGVNAVFLDNLQVVLCGSYRGVVRIDLTNEIASNVSPGSLDTNNNNSPSGFIEDMRTPAHPNRVAFVAWDNTIYGTLVARYRSDDGGLNWTKEWDDDNLSDSGYSAQDNQCDNRVFFDHRISNNRQDKTSGSYPRVRYSTSRIANQTLTFAQPTEVQYGVLYFPVGGPNNLASAVIMRSSGTVTSAQVGASYEIPVGTVYESRISTGVNTVSRFMVIDNTGLVTSHTGTDPGFVTLGPGTDIDLTFPASLPSGSNPDDEFPAGATIQVEVEASNSVASDTYPSSPITPS